MDFLSILIVKLSLDDYFKRMRSWRKKGNYSVCCDIFDEFRGYIRCLYHSELMSEYVYDRLFDIGNNICFGNGGDY